MKIDPNNHYSSYNNISQHIPNIKLQWNIFTFKSRQFISQMVLQMIDPQTWRYNNIFLVFKAIFASLLLVLSQLIPLTIFSDNSALFHRFAIVWQNFTCFYEMQRFQTLLSLINTSYHFIFWYITGFLSIPLNLCSALYFIYYDIIQCQLFELQCRLPEPYSSSDVVTMLFHRYTLWSYHFLLFPLMVPFYPGITDSLPPFIPYNGGYELLLQQYHQQHHCTILPRAQDSFLTPTIDRRINHSSHFQHHQQQQQQQQQQQSLQQTLPQQQQFCHRLASLFLSTPIEKLHSLLLHPLHRLSPYYSHLYKHANAGLPAPSLCTPSSDTAHQNSSPFLLPRAIASSFSQYIPSDDTQSLISSQSSTKTSSSPPCRDRPAQFLQAPLSSPRTNCIVTAIDAGLCSYRRDDNSDNSCLQNDGQKSTKNTYSYVTSAVLAYKHYYYLSYVPSLPFQSLFSTQTTPTMLYQVAMSCYSIFSCLFSLLTCFFVILQHYHESKQCQPRDHIQQHHQQQIKSRNCQKSAVCSGQDKLQQHMFPTHQIPWDYNITILKLICGISLHDRHHNQPKSTLARRNTTPSLKYLPFSSRRHLLAQFLTQSITWHAQSIWLLKYLHHFRTNMCLSSTAPTPLCMLQLTHCRKNTTLRLFQTLLHNMKHHYLSSPSAIIHPSLALTFRASQLSSNIFKKSTSPRIACVISLASGISYSNTSSCIPAVTQPHHAAVPRRIFRARIVPDFCVIITHQQQPQHTQNPQTSNTTSNYICHFFSTPLLLHWLKHNFNKHPVTRQHVQPETMVFALTKS